ncbi:MAG: FAD-dependent oxidoreductase [Bacteroidales bacterium]|nr:FAD-dependent oxidoreductase [Bacteroidales bacterium]MDD2424847.1 FAD-dependent oxidoreductase [Bacteroidales bacterium]MDD3989969.1 FAD-dependent oxidoreductase [Bacteroidales bacterium]MDD4638525.1 FAD-dependent oxidoreductase [Bacteroidales bacterium]
MKYLIIGGVAGGATAAARIRRNDESGEIILFERGNHISFANCGLPYYIGGEIRERGDLLLLSVTAFSNRYDIDTRIRSEVIAIDRSGKRVLVRDLNRGREYYESYDKLILSPGASPTLPPIPGIKSPNVLTLRNIPDIDLIRERVITNGAKRVIIAGGGFIGVEMAENLTLSGAEVTIVEMAGQVMQQVDYTIAALIHHELTSNGIELILSDSVTKIEERDSGVVVYTSGGKELQADLVLWSTGVTPETRLALDAGLETGVTRGIKVDHYLRTADPDIYAVGDVIETTHLVTGKPHLSLLAGPANKQARIAADNAVMGNISTFEGVVSAGIIRIFSLTVGFTGASSLLLKKENIDHISSFTFSQSHASYFPDSSQLTVNTIFSPSDSRVLGVQIAGKEGVDKRIDIISQIIRKGGKVKDLCEVEQCYAPPFSSAKDPVNIAGFVAENILAKRLKIVNPDHPEEFMGEERVFLDVRTEKECEGGVIPGAINIPQEELRFRLDEVPDDKHVIIYCAIGMRAYLSYRILESNGFRNLSVLSGGYAAYNILERERLRLKKSF